MVEVVEMMKRWKSGKEREVIVSCPDCFEGNPKKSMIRGQINPAWWGSPEAEYRDAALVLCCNVTAQCKSIKQMMWCKEGWRGASSVLFG